MNVADIIARVQREGDCALFALAREFDDVTLDTLEVPVGAAVPEALHNAMSRAIKNLRTAHEAFAPKAVEVETEPGIIVGRRPDPLSRVGVYAPGGRATYPSSLLMGAIPAKVAGVREVIVCSPKPSPALLAAAEMAGVDRVFAVGGAGAIAAMAYGTETIPRVDKIVGPGNAYVAEAKLQLAGVVASEAPAGPSELLVIADETADPAIIAREMAAQAEHDPRARVAVVIVGRDVATIDDAIAYANEWAPEHLLLAVAEPESVFARIRNAGAVFLGESSSVTFGDYLTGGNHVLPTGGWARSYSGLSTQDFVRWTSYTRVDRAAAARLAEDTAVFAEAEGLRAHAVAALAWKGV
ncbi:MAG TPA: histidinol dehydrogenase [Gemmatimonadaceae bacterium]|nr:histidinol dehydrogenase [Gemmatimonadaceae bacterium]